MSDDTSSKSSHGMGAGASHLPDVLMEAAWYGFMEWAYGHAEIRERFTTETKLSLERLDVSTGIAALVDKVTGYRDDVLKHFVEWATIEIWGLEYAPAKFREEYEQKAKAATVNKARQPRRYREDSHRLAAQRLDKCTLCKAGAGMPCVTARMKVTAPHKQRRAAEQEGQASP